MKQLNLLKTLFLLCALMVGSSSVWAAEATDTYIFTSKSWTATLNDIAANWTSGKDGAGFSNNGVQVTNNALYTGANATSPISYSNISKIVVTYNTNKSAGEGTFDVQIGENDAVSKNWAYSSGDGRTANYTIQYDYSPAQSGYVKITANTTTNSIYVVSVAITYESDARTPIATIGDLTPMSIAKEAMGTFTVGVTAAAAYTVSYESSDDDILLVDAGTGEYGGVAKGNVTVTVTVTPDDAVTYKPVSKNFTVEVYDPTEKGTKWNPFTVAEAIDFIDAGEGLSNTYYVKGIIHSVESYSSGAISYWISDDGTTDAFECYKGKNINGANFTSVSDLSQGDIVVVKGVMKFYEKSSIYEFNSNNEIVSRKPAVKYVTDAGYATYVAAYDMEFAEGDAFAVTVDGGVAKLAGVTKVKANTPVLLKGEGYKNVTILAETPAAITTDLKVSNGGEPTNAYVLANNTYGVGFYKWAGGSLTSGKVYLDASTSAHELEFIGFDAEEGDVTGISEIETMRNGENEKFFNLAGQRVAQPQKGLYIVNGKKVVIK